MVQSMLAQSIPQAQHFSIADGPQVYNPELRCVVVDLMSISRLLNGSRMCFRLEPYAFQDILVSVCYRLLHHHPAAGDRPENDNENACHLGLLAFMTTLLFQHGRSQRLSYKLLAEKLRNGIRDTSSNVTMEETIFLWLPFIGGISVFRAVDRPWLLPLIKTRLFALNIDSWRIARDKIRKLPWIDAVHDRPGRELWQAMVYA